MKGKILAAILVGVTIVLCAAQSNVKEGDKEYTPTRLEWLATMLNARTKRYNVGFEIQFIEKHKKDTIEIACLYIPRHIGFSRKLMNKQVAAERKTVEGFSKQYGWDSWLKIRERFIEAQ
jgi:hypothetical protein